MRKIHIFFHMKSTDTDVSFEVNGEYKNNRIKFIDPDENTNYIIFHKGNIEYYKKGEMDMKFKFSIDDETVGIYKILGNEFRFRIDTKHLVKDEGHLQIEYHLYQQEDLVNEQVLSIDYDFLEEE